jgi:hypothetical protein
VLFFEISGDLQFLIKPNKEKMKLKTTIITGLATLAFLTFAAGSLQAQIISLVTITATASVQNPTTDNGTVSTTSAPTKVSVTTKQILSALAIAEHIEGNYLPGSTFPAGAKLVVVIGHGGTPPDFQVVDAHNILLVDVSDIISAQNTGQFGSKVTSGKQNDVTGLANPSQTELQIFTLIYDDTAIAGSQNIQFYLTGAMSSVTTDTVPNVATGAYTETQTDKMTDGAGDGNANAVPLVITGSVTAVGKANFVLP